MMASLFKTPERRLGLLLFAILALRLCGLGMYPLMDTSEARYGEIARKMLESGNWITPMFDHGVPFWGKPPLSFWSQAAGMAVFGANGFGARIGTWLFHTATCAIIVRLGAQERDLRTGLLAAIIYSSCALGLVSSGVVLTDPSLAFCVTLAFYGFWRALTHADRPAALLGFVAIGLGLLAKGPLVVVLVGIPLLAWIAFQPKPTGVRRLPWLTGVALVLIIAVPWYVLAELATPGFLKYFILGEHGARFLFKGWQGDLYGTAHAHALGTIWLYLLGSLMPWSFALVLLYRYRHHYREQSAYYSMLLAWGLASPLFFTMASNILWTYALPALPAWALLIADGLRRASPGWRKYTYACAAILPLAIPVIAAEGSYLVRTQNQQATATVWDNLDDADRPPLYYLGRRSYSGEFYTAGRARHADNVGELPPRGTFLLVRTFSDVENGSLPPGFDCTPRIKTATNYLFACQAQAR